MGGVLITIPDDFVPLHTRNSSSAMKMLEVGRAHWNHIVGYSILSSVLSHFRLIPESNIRCCKHACI